MTEDDQLGSSDCERLRDRRPHQPVNTASSAAVAVVGAGVLAAAASRRLESRWPAISLGIGGIAAGAGSMDYHGWHSPLARWMHDVGLVLPLLAVAATDASVARGRRPGGEVVVLSGAATVLVGALLARHPGLGTPVGAVVAALLLPLEAAAWRSRARISPLGRRSRRARSLAYGSLAIGAALQSVSRTGGPLCRPESRLQGHAGWHLATATALGSWAVAALTD